MLYEDFYGESAESAMDKTFHDDYVTSTHPFDFPSPDTASDLDVFTSVMTADDGFHCSWDDTNDAEFSSNRRHSTEQLPIHTTHPIHTTYAVTPPTSTPSIPDIEILQNPPLIWYQRIIGQSFSIRAPPGIRDYVLDLVYQPFHRDDPYQHVIGTRKYPTGLQHNHNTDLWFSDGSLVITPSIQVCSRISGPLFVFRLSFCNGSQILSRPFAVRSKVPAAKSFRKDALLILRQLEWSPGLNLCLICNRSYREGHLTTCSLRAILRSSSRTPETSGTSQMTTRPS